MPQVDEADNVMKDENNKLKLEFPEIKEKYNTKEKNNIDEEIEMEESNEINNANAIINRGGPPKIGKIKMKKLKKDIQNQLT